MTISAMSLRCLHEDLRVVLILSIACIVEVGVIYLGFFFITPIEYMCGLPWLAMFMTRGDTCSFLSWLIMLAASTYARLFSFGQCPRALDNSYM